jgi:hypothetical protein
MTTEYPQSVGARSLKEQNYRTFRKAEAAASPSSSPTSTTKSAKNDILAGLPANLVIQPQFELAHT